MSESGGNGQPVPQVATAELLPAGSRGQLSALYRAVRQPVRQWWLRVGLWWMLAWALLLFLTPIDFRVLLAWGVPVTPPMFWFLRFQTVFGPVARLAAELLFPALWLWAALVALSAIGKLFSQVAAPELAVSRSAQFSVALVQGAPLLPVAALNVVYSAMVRRTMYDGPFSLGPPVAGATGYSQGESWTIQHFLTNGVSSLAGDVALVMVLIALFVLTSRIRYSLILLLAVKLSALAHVVATAIPKPSGYEYVNLGASPVPYTCWLGLLAVVLMLWGLCRRRAWVAWSAYGLLASGSALGIFQRWMVPLPPFEVPAAVRITATLLADSASDLLARGQTFLLPLRDDVSGLLTGAHRLTVYGAEAKVVLPEAWSALILAAAINVLWLALVWAVISWCMAERMPDVADD